MKLNLFLFALIFFVSGAVSAEPMKKSDFDQPVTTESFSFAQIKDLDFSEMIDVSGDRAKAEEQIVQLIFAMPPEYHQYVVPMLHVMRGISDKTLTRPGIAEWRGKIPTRVAPELEEYAKTHLKYLHPLFFYAVMPENWPSYQQKKEGQNQNLLKKKTYSLDDKEAIDRIFASHDNPPAWAFMLKKEGVFDENIAGITDQEAKETLQAIAQLDDFFKTDDGKKIHDEILSMLQPTEMMLASTEPCLSISSRMQKAGVSDDVLAKYRLKDKQDINKCDRMIKAFRFEYAAAPTVANLIEKKKATFFMKPEEAYKKALFLTLVEMYHALPQDLPMAKKYLPEFIEVLDGRSIFLASPIPLDL